MAGQSGGRSGGSERRIVSPVKGGGYRVDKPGSLRASATAGTKKEAERIAKRIVRNAGGGEVTFRDRLGRISDSDTVKPGRDPYLPRDKNH
jgi:hypothetical protein